MSAKSTKTDRAQLIDYIASHLLSRAALLVRLLVKQARDAPLSRTEGEVLRILSDGPRRVTELAELEGVAQPTMTVLVKRLEQGGLVERRGLSGDGRVVMVQITDAGTTMWHAFRAQFLAAMQADLQPLSDQQLTALLDATETLGSFVDELQKRQSRLIEPSDGLP